jgi:hypothetical protein
MGAVLLTKVVPREEFHRFVREVLGNDNGVMLRAASMDLWILGDAQLTGDLLIVQLTNQSLLSLQGSPEIPLEPTTAVITCLHSAHSREGSPPFVAVVSPDHW